MISPRLLRWCLLLSSYEYNLEYRQGKFHANADCLSRLPLKYKVDEPGATGDVLLLEPVGEPLIQAQLVSTNTKRDPILSRISSGNSRTPAKILMGRRLRTAMDKLHPDSIATDQPSAEPVGASRAFNVRDEVYIRNYTHGPKWLTAKIIEVTGPVSYITETIKGEIARSHVDQIMKRTGNQLMAKESKVVISNPKDSKQVCRETQVPRRRYRVVHLARKMAKTVTTRVSTLNRKWNQATTR